MSCYCYSLYVINMEILMLLKLLFYFSYNLVDSFTNSTLNKYIVEGDNRNARLLSQMVASRLNRRNKYSCSNQLDSINCFNRRNVLRRSTRESILSFLVDLPVREEVSFRLFFSRKYRNQTVYKNLVKFMVIN